MEGSLPINFFFLWGGGAKSTVVVVTYHNKTVIQWPKRTFLLINEWERGLPAKVRLAAIRHAPSRAGTTRRPCLINSSPRSSTCREVASIPSDARKGNMGQTATNVPRNHSNDWILQLSNDLNYLNRRGDSLAPAVIYSSPPDLVSRSLSSTSPSCKNHGWLTTTVVQAWLALIKYRSISLLACQARYWKQRGNNNTDGRRTRHFERP